MLPTGHGFPGGGPCKIGEAVAPSPGSPSSPGASSSPTAPGASRISESTHWVEKFYSQADSCFISNLSPFSITYSANKGRYCCWQISYGTCWPWLGRWWTVYIKLGALSVGSPGARCTSEMLSVVLLFQGLLCSRLHMLFPHAHLLHHLYLNGLCLDMLHLKFNIYDPKKKKIKMALPGHGCKIKPMREVSVIMVKESGSCME